jgi:hypothetical protein
MLKQYPHQLLSEWLDITLAAKERSGTGFFKRSPAAYFVDNVTQAHAGHRTAPDWWHEVRKAEDRARAERARGRTEARNGMPVPAIHGSEAFDRVRNDIFGHFLAAGQSSSDAKANANRFAQEHMRRAPASVKGKPDKHQ